jgi:multiple sugar transport system permease protein
MVWKNILLYLTLILAALYFLFPTVFMIVSSFKTDDLQLISDMSGIRGFIPYGQIGLDNYRTLFTDIKFHKFFFNSLWILVWTIGLGVFINSLMAYALARIPFPGRKILLTIVISLMIIPIEAVAIPMLLLVNRAGLLDTYTVQVIPFIADAFSIFLFYQFFLNIPKDLDEAAIVDGAGYFTIYKIVIIPLSRPVIASVAILQSIQRWGEFLWPLMATREERVRPLTIAIQQFFAYDPKEWGQIFSFAALITLPVLLLFLIFQKSFFSSVASSGIKG